MMISIMLFVCLYTFCTTYSVCVHQQILSSIFLRKVQIIYSSTQIEFSSSSTENYYHQTRPYSRQRAPRSRNYTLSVDLSLHSILILSAFLLYFVLRFSGFPAPNLNLNREKSTKLKQHTRKSI